MTEKIRDSSKEVQLHGAIPGELPPGLMYRVDASGRYVTDDEGRRIIDRRPEGPSEQTDEDTFTEGVVLEALSIHGERSAKLKRRAFGRRALLGAAVVAGMASAHAGANYVNTNFFLPGASVTVGEAYGDFFARGGWQDTWPISMVFSTEGDD